MIFMVVDFDGRMILDGEELSFCVVRLLMLLSSKFSMDVAVSTNIMSFDLLPWLDGNG